MTEETTKESPDKRREAKTIQNRINRLGLSNDQTEMLMFMNLNTENLLSLEELLEEARAPLDIAKPDIPYIFYLNPVIFGIITIVLSVLAAKKDLEPKWPIAFGSLTLFYLLTACGIDICDEHQQRHWKANEPERINRALELWINNWKQQQQPDVENTTLFHGHIHKSIPHVTEQITDEKTSLLEGNKNPAPAHLDDPKIVYSDFFHRPLETLGLIQEEDEQEEDKKNNPVNIWPYPN